MANDDLISRYEKAYENYQNRRMSWVKKFHAVVKEIPHVKYAKNITEKSIKRLQKEVWPKLTERTKKKARKEYERLYEEGAEGIYFPKPPYKPPTEEDFLKIPVQDILPRTVPAVNEEPDDDGYKEPVDSRAEIMAWIDRNIYGITVERENEGAREKLERLVIEAADAYGDDNAYYIYLENNTARLNQLAEEVIKYHRKGSYGYQEETVALTQFATILNLGRPLSPHESERLENEGWVGFDFNDLQ